MIAVVTGASEGLGKEFAVQLAKKGYDLLLIARRESKLNQVKDEITAKFPVNVAIYVCDLSKSDEVLRLEKRLEAEDSLELLVNNAGFGREGAFPNVDPDLEQEMIQVHIIALMRLCRAALIPMCKRKKGYIVNVSSVAAYLHGANCAEYMATKAYVRSFSKSLQCDVRPFGVRVQALCPGLIHTGFHATESMRGFKKDKTPRIVWLNSDFVVKSSLNSIFKTRNVVCVPSWRYKILLMLLCNPIGATISEWIYEYRAKMNQKIPPV
ncbi:MAG: SDR family NAD(P)-dependent oxidoreductase [Thermoguttaceae bacterium]